jgi:hypothetical protein
MQLPSDVVDALKACEAQFRTVLLALPRPGSADGGDSVFADDAEWHRLRTAVVRLDSALGSVGLAETCEYSLLQEYFSGLDLAVLPRLEDSGARGAVGRQVSRSVRELLKAPWLTNASVAVRDFVAFDLSTVLFAAARRAGTWRRDARVDAIGLDVFAAALETTYTSGYIPYGWKGVFPHGCPLRAALYVRT